MKKKRKKRESVEEVRREQEEADRQKCIRVMEVTKSLLDTSVIKHWALERCGHHL